MTLLYELSKNKNLILSFQKILQNMYLQDILKSDIKYLHFLLFQETSNPPTGIFSTVLIYFSEINKGFILIAKHYQTCFVLPSESCFFRISKNLMKLNF
ncbi:hypothetical protein MYP_2679 [Sporocytophaga myxococcoides]|uniref:Uncharacterized protein n=1 Tax=Sporocytophaga myxococcoides TaxID=153721 RepID=A0A098LEU4_9BACT|nr:hypothetical protein MYP_2679 [Sporocytophaga myxococcoides]